MVCWITFETMYYLTLFIEIVLIPQEIFCSQLLQYWLKFIVSTSSLIAGTVLYYLNEIKENTFFNVYFIVIYTDVAYVIFSSFSFYSDTFATIKIKTARIPSAKVIPNLCNFYTKICTIAKSLLFTPAILL